MSLVRDNYSLLLFCYFSMQPLCPTGYMRSSKGMYVFQLKAFFTLWDKVQSIPSLFQFTKIYFTYSYNSQKFICLVKHLICSQVSLIVYFKLGRYSKCKQSNQIAMLFLTQSRDVQQRKLATHCFLISELSIQSVLFRACAYPLCRYVFPRYNFNLQSKHAECLSRF